MGAIVCRACRFAHDGPCKAVVPVSGAKVAIQGGVAVLHCAGCAAMAAKIKVLEARLDKQPNTLDVKSNKFDKNAYQREYMRKRRAKQQGVM